MQSQSENPPNIGMEVQEGNSQETSATSGEGGNVHVESTSNGNQKPRGSQRLLKDDKGEDKISSKEQDSDSTKPIVKQSTSTEDTNGTKCKFIKLHAKTEVQKSNENVNFENENISTKTRAATRLKQENIKETGDANGSTDNVDIPENEESPHTRSSRSATKVHRENKAEDASHESHSSNVTGQSEKLNKLKSEKTPAKNLRKDQKEASGECNSAPFTADKRETPIRNVPEVGQMKTGSENDMTEDSGSTKNIATEKTLATKKSPKVYVEKLAIEVNKEGSQNVSVDPEVSHETPKDTKRKSKRLVHPDKSPLDVSDDGLENISVDDEMAHETPKDIKRKSKKLSNTKDEKEVTPRKSDKSILGSSRSTGNYSSPRIITSRRPIRESFSFAKEINISHTIKKSEERERNVIGIESGSSPRKYLTLNSSQDDSFEVKRQTLKRKSDAEFSASNKKSCPTRGLDSSSFFSMMSSPLQMLSQKEDPVNSSASKIMECENPCDIKIAEFDVEDDLVSKHDVSSQQIVDQKDKKWCLLM